MNARRRADKLLVSPQWVCGKCAVIMLLGIVASTGRVLFALVGYVGIVGKCGSSVSCRPMMERSARKGRHDKCGR